MTILFVLAINKRNFFKKRNLQMYNILRNNHIYMCMLHVNSTYRSYDVKNSYLWFDICVKKNSEFQVIFQILNSNNFLQMKWPCHPKNTQSHPCWVEDIFTIHKMTGLLKRIICSCFLSWPIASYLSWPIDRLPIMAESVVRNLRGWLVPARFLGAMWSVNHFVVRHGIYKREMFSIILLLDKN